MILILGGTTEASMLARRMAMLPGLRAVLSLAGRTKNPALPPIPCRIGGFGGVDGLVAYLRGEKVKAVIDATHPFAARIKVNVAEACASTGVPLLALGRPAWTAVPGDRWTEVADAEAAAEAIGPEPRRVFLTAGRLEVPAFLAHPQHHYWVRSVDAPEALPPGAKLILDRGPFDAGAEKALMEEAGIEVLVTKNSGGSATYGKIEAARRLGLPVILIRRPTQPDVSQTGNLDEAVAFAFRHGGEPASTDRGV